MQKKAGWKIDTCFSKQDTGWCRKRAVEKLIWAVLCLFWEPGWHGAADSASGGHRLVSPATANLHAALHPVNHRATHQQSLSICTQRWIERIMASTHLQVGGQLAACKRWSPHSHTNQFDWLTTHHHTQPHKPVWLAYHSSPHTATQTSTVGLTLIVTHSHTNQHHWLTTHYHTQPHKPVSLAYHSLSHTATLTTGLSLVITQTIGSSHSHIPLVYCIIIRQPHTTGLLHHHHTDIPLANHSSSSQKAHFPPTMKQTELCATSVCLCHFQHWTGKHGGYHQGGPLQMHASCQQRWRDQPCSHGDGPRLQPAHMDTSSMSSHLPLTTLTV